MYLPRGIPFVQWIKHLLLIALVGSLLACANTGGLPSAGEEVRDNRAVRSLLVDAVTAQQGGDMESAARLFEQMMAAEPRSPDALNSYAIFLREQWRIDEAESTYRRALEYSPGNPMTHWNLAVLYDLYMGDHKQALKHYQAYQKHSPEPDRRVQGWISQLQQQAQASE